MNNSCSMAVHIYSLHLIADSKTNANILSSVNEYASVVGYVWLTIVFAFIVTEPIPTLDMIS